MASRGRRSSGLSTHRHYEFESPEPDTKKAGWLAGPIHVLLMHGGQRKSVVCLKHLVGAKHECRGCKGHGDLEEMGFVPLRAENGRPTTVIVRKGTIGYVEALKPGLPIFYGRGATTFDPVFVIPRAAGQPWAEAFPDQRPDDAMASWFPVYFKLPNLLPYFVEWFKEECQSAVTVEEPIPPATIDCGQPRWVGGVVDAAMEQNLGPGADDAKRKRDARNAAYVDHHVRNGKKGAH